MKERPILFSAEMVRAILAGRKTQTRRIIKLDDFQPAETKGYDWMFRDRHALWNEVSTQGLIESRCPYGMPGDRLWVRESFQVVEPYGSDGDEWIGDDLQEIDGPLGSTKPEQMGHWWQLIYKADEPEMCKWWRPSFFMPRWASRITLEICTVRVEQLQRIGGTDAWADGGLTVQQFIDLWNSINAKRGYSWDANPWVWVIEFKKLEE